MDHCDWSRRQHPDILADDRLSFVTEDFLNFIAHMNDLTELLARECYNNDAYSWILLKVSPLRLKVPPTASALLVNSIRARQSLKYMEGLVEDVLCLLLNVYYLP